jgi:protein-tyrosine phosphatase
VSGSSPSGPAPFTVLAVCTGNVCRSPAVEALLGDAWPVEAGVHVSSAGLRARVGEPMTPDMASALGRQLPGFAARQVSSELLRPAGLVLAMTRTQRSALVTAAPEAVRRTFTLREFAGLVVLARDSGALDVGGSLRDRLAAAVEAVPKFRAQRTAGPDDDIEDPYGRDRRQYDRTAEQIRACVTPLLDVLREG